MELFEGGKSKGIDADPGKLTLDQLEEVIRKDEKFLKQLHRKPEADQVDQELREKISEDLFQAMDSSREEREKYYLGDLKGIHVQYIDENYEIFLKALHDLEKHLLQLYKKELDIPEPHEDVGNIKEYLRIKPFLERKSKSERLARGEELLVYLMESYIVEKQSSEVLSVYIKRLLEKNKDEYDQALEEMYSEESPEKLSGAAVSNGKIFYSGIPKDMDPEYIVDKLDFKVDERSFEILKIFLNTLYRRAKQKESQKFKYTVLHERTHCYIQNNVYIGSDRKLKAIEEGACQAISYIGTGWSSPPDGYREDKNYPLHVLEYTKFALLLYSDKAETPMEKVEAIRNQAVKVLESAKKRGKTDLADIITNRRTTKKAHRFIIDSLGVIEETIEISSYSLYLLGQINEEDLREYINRHDIDALIDPNSGEINEELRYKEIHEVVDHAKEGIRQYFFPPYIEIVQEYLKSEYRNLEQENSSKKKMKQLENAIEAWETLERSYSEELEQFSTIENSSSNIKELHEMEQKNYDFLPGRGDGRKSTDTRKMVRYVASQNQQEEQVEPASVKEFPKIQEVLGSNEDVETINLGDRIGEKLAKYEKLVKNALEEKNKIINGLKYLHDIEKQVIQPEHMKGFGHPAPPPKNYDPEEFFKESRKDLKMAKESRKQLKAVLKDLEKVRKESEDVNKRYITMNSLIIN